jgi:hypothetical protein
MAKRQKARGAGEATVPPARSSSERERLETAVASLSGLNADQLRLQWRNHLGGIPPAHLPGWLMARLLAYRIQAAEFGDLDRAILRRLREMKSEALGSGQAPPFATRGPTTRKGVGLKPGALLVREWNGRIERVMVLEQRPETASSGRCAMLAVGSTNFLSTLPRPSSRSPCANTRVSARFG